MDLDKPLEEMISDKKTTQGARRGNGAPRSRGRGNGPTPYARPPPRSTEEKWVHDAYEDNVARGGRRGGGGGAPRGGYSGFNSTLAGTGVGFTGVSPRIEVVGLHYEVTPADLKGHLSKDQPSVPLEYVMCAVGFEAAQKQDSHSSITFSGNSLVQEIQKDHKLMRRFLACFFWSRGEATMEFASYQEAKIAINKFDGAMTKGQTISIRLLPPARAPPAAGAASGGPGRGGAQTGASLLARLGGQGGASGASNAPRGGAGPRGRGAPRARGGDAARGRGGAKRGPVNEGDLDKELDNFMAPAEGEKAPTADVEMA